METKKMVFTGKANTCHMWTFSLPAKKTCPFAGKCKGFCFASNGHYLGKDAVACYNRNFEASKLAEFPGIMVAQVKEAVRLDSKRGLQTVVRLHDGGDLYSVAYLLKWIRISEQCPEVMIYGYTKSHPFFFGLTLPENLYFIPSEGGTRDDLIMGLPRAKTVPIGYVCGPGEVPGDMDDLRNLSMVRDQRMVLCLEAHGAQKSKVQ